MLNSELVLEVFLFTSIATVGFVSGIPGLDSATTDLDYKIYGFFWLCNMVLLPLILLLSVLNSSMVIQKEGEKDMPSIHYHHYMGTNWDISHMENSLQGFSQTIDDYIILLYLTWLQPYKLLGPYDWFLNLSFNFIQRPKHCSNSKLVLP